MLAPTSTPLSRPLGPRKYNSPGLAQAPEIGCEVSCELGTLLPPSSLFSDAELSSRVVKELRAARQEQCGADEALQEARAARQELLEAVRDEAAATRREFAAEMSKLFSVMPPPQRLPDEKLEQSEFQRHQQLEGHHRSLEKLMHDHYENHMMLVQKQLADHRTVLTDSLGSRGVRVHKTRGGDQASSGVDPADKEDFFCVGGRGSSAGFAPVYASNATNGATTRRLSRAHLEHDLIERAELADKSEKERRKSETVEKFMAIFVVLPDNSPFRELASVLEWFLWLEEPERDGCLGRLICHPKFEVTCTLVIVLNAMFAAWLADWEIQHLNAAPSSFITFTELGLMLFYLTELLLNLAVHRLFFFCNAEWKWNIFDFALVLTSVYNQTASLLPDHADGANLSFMRMVRLLKLTKVMRVFRVVRFLRELRLMLSAIQNSFVSLFWCLILLGFVLYIFGLTLLQGVTLTLAERADSMSSEEVEQILTLFGSMRAMTLSLYKSVTGGADWGELFDVLSWVGSAYSSLFIFYTAFFYFVVTNILTGMIVENVGKMALLDSDAMIWSYRQQQLSAMEDMKSVFKLLDATGDGTIGLDEFREGMKSDTVQALMSALMLEVKDTEWFFHMLLAISESDILDIESFVSACMKIKGEATSIDLQCVAFELRVIRNKIDDLEKNFDMTENRESTFDLPLECHL